MGLLYDSVSRAAPWIRDRETVGFFPPRGTLSSARAQKSPPARAALPSKRGSILARLGRVCEEDAFSRG